MRIQPLLLILFLVGMGTIYTGCSDSDDPSAPRTDPSVVGCITELDSGDPVSDAAVILIDRATLLPGSSMTPTNAQGEYALYGVASGVYYGVVFHDSLTVCDRTSGTITVIEGATTTWDARIQPAELWGTPEYRIEGTIRDAQTQRGLSQAYVSPIFWSSMDVPAYVHGIGMPRMSIADEQGHYSIEGLRVVDHIGHDLGIFPVTVSCPGYESATIAGAIDAGFSDIGFLPIPQEGDSVLTADIALKRRTSESPAGALKGLVTFLGVPVADLSVALSIDAVSDPDTLGFGSIPCAVIGGQTTTTTQAGEFLFTDLTPGAYVVHPAYRLDDGYHSYGRLIEDRDVVDGDTLDVGTIEVQMAITCHSPEDGAVVDTQTPTFSWCAVPDTLGYELLSYEIEMAVNSWYSNRTIELGRDPHWQPASGQGFAPASHVKWSVHAIAANSAIGDTARIATTERFRTFEVTD